MNETSVKQELLAVSERLVDLSDELDRLREAGNDSGYSLITKQLRDIGDQLIDYTKFTEGDDRAYTYFSLGSLCSMLGYHQQAEKSYREALTQWPDHVGLLNEMFDCLMEQHKYAPAKDIIENSIRHGGETPIILQNYAVVLTHLKKLNEARIVLFNCMAKFPGDQPTIDLLKTLEGG
ncbi:MAG: tetratricopeptide repeat protein [Balneolales bacterium]